MQVEDINQIRFKQLKQLGIKYLIYDKDNTITLPYSDEIYHKIKEPLKDSIEIFGLDNVAILSNSIGSSDDRDFKVNKCDLLNLGCS